MKRQKSYTTEDEMLFIQKIGQHSENTKNINKLNLLKKYIKTLEFRQNCEMIDKKILINFANNYLKELSHV